MNSIHRLRHSAVSEVGLKRRRNEDAFGIYDSAAAGESPGTEGVLFVVADGIGGHACGDLASRMACDGLRVFFDEAGKADSPRACAQRLAQVIRGVDAQVRERAAGDPACADMGSTLSALLVADGFGVLAHVGDSRIYRMRAGRLMRLSTDHTFVQEMIAEGELSPEAVENHPFRNVLTRAVGTPEPLEEIETEVFVVKPGDRFLLATDGLNDMVADAEIGRILGDTGVGPEPTARILVDAALENGGRDNITVIVVDA